MNTRNISVGVGIVLGIFIAVWLATAGDNEAPKPTQTADTRHATKDTLNTMDGEGAAPKSTAPIPAKPDSKAKAPTAAPPSDGSPSQKSATDAGLANDRASDASPGMEDESASPTDEGKERGGADALPPKEKLERALQGVAFPSVLMCLNERVARGDSFSGSLDFAVRVTANPDDPNNADIELKSVDGKSLGQEDFACIWSGFEDQVLPIKDTEVGELLKGQDGVDSRFEISIDVKGAPKDEPQK